MGTNKSILTTDEINSYYGESHILHDVSLSVNDGQVMGLLGRNGVGKTTFVHTLIGFIQPRSGRITFKDEDITNFDSYRIAQRGMSLVPQGRRVLPSLTVKENLKLASRLSANRKDSEWNLERVLEIFPRLSERLSHGSGQLSGGEQQMLATARALISNPDIILMDEPTEGLAPVIIDRLSDLLSRIRQEGISILLVEQNLNFALKHVDTISLMSKGQIVKQTTPDELENNEELQSQYLGI